jgi:hypothetical protein
MPGAGRRFDFEFHGGTPLLLKVTTAILVVNFVVSFVISAWVERSLPQHVTDSCTYPLHYKGGLTVFVSPILGYYIDWSFWGHFMLLTVCFLLILWYAISGRASLNQSA